MNPRAWSLTTKLVASVVALFVALTLVIGGTTVLVMREQLVAQIDEQLAKEIGPGGGKGPNPCVMEGPGQGEDSLLACLSNDGSTGFVVLDREKTLLDDTQMTQITDAGIGQDPTTVDLDGLGEYRLVAERSPSGVTAVVGSPLEPASDATRSLLVVVGATSLAGLILVLLVGPFVIRRQLAPLTRVAATAHKVSRLRLDSGEVALAERVPEQDTDPRTEVGQVGEAINSMLDNVSGALEARQRSEQRVRQFVADASHELRTPLASIRGYAELSRKESEPVPASVQHNLSRVESESLRMQGLVEDLLLLARLDAGRPLVREPVDLTMLAMTAVGDIHAAAPDHHWRLDLPDEPVEVTGDQGRLTQVLVNLLANARTHTPAGTTVTTSLRQVGDEVLLAVRDDGPGVPDALRDDVFERFTRGDDARNRAGGSTGLGLSIVDSVAQAHGGRVALDSRPGRTEFTVHLPL